MNGLTGFDVAGWQPLSLAELNARAPLLDRQENKYMLTSAILAESVQPLRRQFDRLTINGTAAFTYETTYFDTNDLLTYRQHAQGRRRRLKIRSRRYVHGDSYFFEVKLKGRRGRTIKERMPYRGPSHGRIGIDAHDFVRRCVRDSYGEEFVDGLAPTLAMRYRRITLVGKDTVERVTIDFDLEFAIPGGEVVAAPHGLLIVEVKSENGRGAADRILHRAGCRPARCSKYCIGLNLVRPGLQYNQFKRQLVNHFEWSPPTARSQPGRVVWPPPAAKAVA